MKFPFLLLTIGLGWFQACDRGVALQEGTGTQTGNGLAGRVLTLEDGLPAGGVRVKIRPENWSPSDTGAPEGSLRDTLTDSLGRFRIPGVPAGRYLVQMFVPSCGSPACLSYTGTNRSYGPEKAVTRSCSVVEGRETDLADSRLEKTSNLRLEMALSDSTRGGRIDVLGTGYSTICTVTGTLCAVDFRDIPAGSYRIRVWSNHFRMSLMGVDLDIAPGTTDTVGVKDWDRSLKAGPQ